MTRWNVQCCVAGCANDAVDLVGVLPTCDAHAYCVDCDGRLTHAYDVLVGGGHCQRCLQIDLERQKFGDPPPPRNDYPF